MTDSLYLLQTLFDCNTQSFFIYRQSMFVTDRLCPSHAFCVCHRLSVCVKDIPCLSQTVSVCHRQSLSVTDSLCLSQTIFVGHKQSESVTNNLCLSQAVCVCHRHSSWSLLTGFSLFILDFHRDLAMRFYFVQHLNTTNTNFVVPFPPPSSTKCGWKMFF